MPDFDRFCPHGCSPKDLQETPQSLPQISGQTRTHTSHTTLTMLFLDLRILLLSLTTHPIFSEPRIPTPKSFPRSLDAILIDPSPSPSPSPAPTSPFLRHLDLRQVAAPAAAAPAANANGAAAAPAAANPAAPAVAPAAAAPAAPAAPAAGVGGAGAAPAAGQPTPGAQANPVTTIQVVTVVGGVTKTVPSVYSQQFGGASTAPPVLTGTIGLGTLTGKIGVVKTQDAKSDAVRRTMASGRAALTETVVVLVMAGVMTVGGGVLGIARL